MKRFEFFRPDLREFLSTKVVQVWHQDSPGMRVFVRRNWWQRLFYNRHFSEVGEKHLAPYEMVDTKLQAIRLATRFHELYERKAPLYGYTTREDTREFDSSTPNGKLMTDVCLDLITGGYTMVSPEEEKRRYEELTA